MSVEYKTTTCFKSRAYCVTLQILQQEETKTCHAMLAAAHTNKYNDAVELGKRWIELLRMISCLTSGSDTVWIHSELARNDLETLRLIHKAL